MGIRKPLQTVLDYTDTGTGATSIVSQTFTIPQDTDNVVLKVPIASVNGSVPVVDIILQTTDDGGTTYYDVACLRPPTVGTSSIINTINGTALFASVPVVGGRGSVIGTAQNSILTGNAYTGLPILSDKGRVLIRYTSGNVVANNGVRVQVKVNSEAQNR